MRTRLILTTAKTRAKIKPKKAPAMVKPKVKGKRSTILGTASKTAFHEKSLPAGIQDEIHLKTIVTSCKIYPQRISTSQDKGMAKATATAKPTKLMITWRYQGDRLNASILFFTMSPFLSKKVG